MPDISTLATVAASFAAVVAAIVAAARWAARRLRRLEQFFADWFGTAPRPGVPARPGVMARLDDLDHRTAAIEHELHPNSGASLRDAVDRIDSRTAPTNRKG